jgi:hypothetical protein
MLKVEFSYTAIFSNRIGMFISLFMILDMLLEQVLVRTVMHEALLITPMLTAFTSLEFVMTMGAADFKSFIISNFISYAMTIVDRMFISPFVERIEHWLQYLAIWLSKKSTFFRSIFKDMLMRQLSQQLELMSLNEYNERHQRRKETAGLQRKLYDF